MKVILILALLCGNGCASRSGYQFGEVRSVDLFHAGQFYYFDWGFRIEMLEVVAKRSDGWVQVRISSRGESQTWWVNPLQALGVMPVTVLPEVKSSGLQADIR
jgi:hypothetical protein